MADTLPSNVVMDILFVIKSIYGKKSKTVKFSFQKSSFDDIPNYSKSKFQISFEILEIVSNNNPASWSITANLNENSTLKLV